LLVHRLHGHRIVQRRCFQAFHALFYLQTILKIDPRTANVIVAVALLLGIPLFVVFGSLSDRIGRNQIRTSQR